MHYTIKDKNLVGLKFSESAKESVWLIKVQRILLSSHYWYKKFIGLDNEVQKISIASPNSPNPTLVNFLLIILNDTRYPIGV